MKDKADGLPGFFGGTIPTVGPPAMSERWNNGNGNAACKSCNTYARKRPASHWYKNRRARVQA